MTKLINIIDEITKYGLQTNLKIENKESDLEEYLVEFYSEYFSINYNYDESDYPAFDKIKLPNIIENVKSNFPNFGLYHEVWDCHELNKKPNIALGDAVDDLSDIIFDLLEIKWRAENNSHQDALWFFQLIFRSHTQQHIISLLNYMKSKYG